MTTLEDYDSMEIRTTLSWETNHTDDDDYEEWVEESGYEWRSWEDTFKGEAAISEIFSDSAKGYSYDDDYTQLNETTIIWRGKEVKCDLAWYEPTERTIPLLEMIWERDGAEVKTYEGKDKEELEKRNQAFWDLFKAK